MQEGLAVAYEVPVAAVRRAAMLSSSTTAAARVLVDGGLAALEQVGLTVGTGIQPMLAASAPDVTEATAKSGLPALVDHKLDGIRVQVHKDGDADQDLHPVAGRDHRAAARGQCRGRRTLPYRTLVLDGEVLAFAVRTGGRRAFQVTASRTGSQLDVAGHSERTPLRVLLLRPAARGRPRSARRAADRADGTIMARGAAGRADRAAPRSATTEAELAAVFASAVAGRLRGRGGEAAGFARTRPGRRSAPWLKVKQAGYAGSRRARGGMGKWQAAGLAQQSFTWVRAIPLTNYVR